MPLISGYFKPLMPVENMFAFTAVSTDGIERVIYLLGGNSEIGCTANLIEKE